MPVRFHPSVGWEARAYQAQQERESRRRAHLAHARANPSLGERLAAHARTQPWSKPGVVEGLARSGVDADDPMALGVAERTAERQARSGFGWTRPGGTENATFWRRLLEVGRTGTAPLRSLTRGAFAGMEDLRRIPSAAATSVGMARQEEGLMAGLREGAQWLSPTTMFGQIDDLPASTTARVIEGIRSGEETDLGEGWFPSGELVEQTEREFRSHFTDDSGQWWSPGRLAARRVAQPGTDAFDTLSGVVDAAFAIVGDPSSIALDAGSKAMAARKAFTGDKGLRAAFPHAARTTDKLLESFGGISSHRRTVIPEKAVDDFLLRDRRGQRVVEWLTREGDFDTIWKGLK